MSGKWIGTPEFWRALEFGICVTALQTAKKESPEIVDWLQARVATAQKALWEVEGK